MAYNSCTMHRLIEWFVQYVQEHKLENVHWRMDAVVNPNLMRVEHIPMHLRLQAIEQLMPLLGKLTNDESINSLIAVLRSTQQPSAGSFEELVEYTRVLDNKRNQSVAETFPHLKEVFV